RGGGFESGYHRRRPGAAGGGPQRLGRDRGGGPLTLFLAAVLLGMIAAGWVIVPLVLRRRAPLVDAEPSHMIDMDARRRVALASLKEVEYDRVSRKLD